MTNEQRVDEQLKNEFILQQLVSQIAALDLTDEVNRWKKCLVYLLTVLNVHLFVSSMRFNLCSLKLLMYKYLSSRC